MSDQEEEMIQIEVPKSFSLGFYPKKKIFVPKSTVQSVVDGVESELNGKFELEKEKIKKETLRKVAEENLKFSPGSTLDNFDESLKGLGSTALKFTQFDLNTDNLKKDFTDPMFNIQRIQELNLRGFNIDTSENKFKIKTMGAFLQQSALKFKDLMNTDSKYVPEKKNVKDEETLIEDFSKTIEINEDENTSQEDNSTSSETNSEKKSKKKKNKKSNIKTSISTENKVIQQLVLDKQQIRDELFYLLKCSPFLYFSIIDNVEAYKMVQDFEKKFDIKGLSEDFKESKSKWYTDHIDEEMDEEEICKFTNFFSISPIEEGKAKIVKNEKFLTKCEKIRLEFDTIVNGDDKNFISDLKAFILKYSKDIKNENYFSGLDRNSLSKLASETIESIESFEKEKSQMFYEAFIDDLDQSKMNEDSLKWVKSKVLYYSRKSFFGIPCNFICMMNENWIHGNYELLDGNNTRWLTV